MGFQQLEGGYLIFGSPHNNDYGALGSILGSPHCGNYHKECHPVLLATKWLCIMALITQRGRFNQAKHAGPATATRTLAASRRAR